MTSVPYGVSGLAFQQASMTRDGSVSRMHFGRPSGLVQPDALPSSNSVSPALLASAPLSQTTSMLSQVSSMGGSSIPVHFDQHGKHQHSNIICDFSSKYRVLPPQHEDIVASKEIGDVLFL